MSQGYSSEQVSKLTTDRVALAEARQAMKIAAGQSFLHTLPQSNIIQSILDLTSATSVLMQKIEEVISEREPPKLTTRRFSSSSSVILSSHQSATHSSNLDHNIYNWFLQKRFPASWFPMTECKRSCQLYNKFKRIVEEAQRNPLISLEYLVSQLLLYIYFRTT